MEVTPQGHAHVQLQFPMSRWSVGHATVVLSISVHGVVLVQDKAWAGMFCLLDYTHGLLAFMQFKFWSHVVADVGVFTQRHTVYGFFLYRV